ncbi:RidA family protein [Flaviflagellibacter deserti]|uniref:RidA family protein n=1 Tax=Flaviflagellibacter deserti TaxID=2267266 RepID=A0ABV9Z060_9HYPH
MAGQTDARLAELGITLPTPTPPVANYVPAVITGNQLFISGQLPMVDGKPSVTGQLGAGTDADAAKEAAKLCAINVLAQAKTALGGDLDRVVRLVKVVGFVASAPSFTEQPKIVNGASDFFVEALGDRGRHARSAVGVAALPFGASVEVEAIFEIA